MIPPISALEARFPLCMSIKNLKLMSKSSKSNGGSAAFEKALIDLRGGPKRVQGHGMHADAGCPIVQCKGAREAARIAKRRSSRKIFPIPRGEGLHI